MKKPPTSSLTLLLDDLLPDPDNVRTHAAGVKELACSIKALGLLQPLLVRPMPAIEGEPQRYMVIDGHMRLAGAIKAGLKTVPVMVMQDTDEQGGITARQTAANMVRSALTAPETWAAVDRMMREGMTIKQAQAALGLTDRVTRRMERLGQLPPAILEAISTGEVSMPDDDVLGRMLLAPAELVAKAWAEARPRDSRAGWWQFESMLRSDRIEASKALFEPIDHPEITWQDDLFVDKANASTPDVDAFMKAQLAALARRCAALQAGGMLISVIEAPKQDYQDPPLPDGWCQAYGGDHRASWDAVDRVPAGATRWVWVGSDGAIRVFALREIIKSANSAAAKPAAPTPKMAEPITKDGAKAIELAQRQAVGEQLGHFLNRSDLHIGIMAIGLLLAERTGCTTKQREAMLNALWQDEAHISDGLRAIAEVAADAIEQTGYNQPHSMAVVRNIGQALGASTHVQWSENELAWLKRGPLEALAQALKVEGPVNATQKATRKLIVAKGQEGKVLLRPCDLPLLSLSPLGHSWPHSMNQGGASTTSAADEDDENEDGGAHDPADDDDADEQALASAYGPAD